MVDQSKGGTIGNMRHPHLHGKKVCNVYTQMYMVRKTMFSNQTSQFPTQYLQVNNYIMVMVEMDSNAIIVEPMKNHKDAKMIWAYNALLLQLKRAGIVPKKHVLDNEVSKNMKNHICYTCKLDMELVPPGCHRYNAAEIAICNFKAHFLSILASVANVFPPNHWDWLLPQTKITINLIWQSNATPNVLAHAHLSRPFDYSKMPLAPMGCEHEKTYKRGTWAYHLVTRWYLFTLPEHYCTHNCHIKHTKSKQLSDMVKFQHKRITNTSITHTDKVMHALEDCVKAIKGMMGKARTSQATQDLQPIVDATQAHLQAHLNKFEETITPDDTRNMQQVPRVQAPPSVPKPHINDNRQITRSMQPQSPVPRMPTNKPTGNPISTPLVATTNNPTSKPDRVPGIKPATLPADLSKHECLCKQQATQLCNATTPTSPTPCNKNPSTSGNRSSLSCTPFFEHTFMDTTVGRATANTLARLCRGSHETATAATQTGSPLMPHHMTGEQSPSSNSNGSNGQVHGQAPQLLATNEQPKIQKKHGAFQQPTNLGDWRMALEVA
jgi:hypothetical protein